MNLNVGQTFPEGNFKEASMPFLLISPTLITETLGLIRNSSAFLRKLWNYLSFPKLIQTFLLCFFLINLFPSHFFFVV